MASDEPRCVKRLMHHKGAGCSCANATTYCVFTVRGYCACPDGKLPPVEA